MKIFNCFGVLIRNGCLVLLLCGLTSIAEARIGETLAEIEPRMGKPQHIQEGIHMWEVNGMAYCVQFDSQGESVVEMLIGLSATTKITETQKAKFLNAHLADGVEWAKVDSSDVLQGIPFGETTLNVNPFLEHVYRSTDGQLMARHIHVGTPKIIVLNKTGARILLAERKAKEEKEAATF